MNTKNPEKQISIRGLPIDLLILIFSVIPDGEEVMKPMVRTHILPEEWELLL